LKELGNQLGLKNMGVELLDARNLRQEDAYFDLVFSVSVIEHIPGEGDRQAMVEIARVLKSGGRAVISVPYKQEYLEEYERNSNLYWKEHTTNRDGKMFYQRRYNWKALESRLINPSGLRLCEAVLVGEKPLHPGNKANRDGRLVENWNFIDSLASTKFLKRLARRMNWSDQWIYSWYSRRCHFFTKDTDDTQALNVVLVLEKD
jgi:SAM-dependent methyltransferase